MLRLKIINCRQIKKKLTRQNLSFWFCLLHYCCLQIAIFFFTVIIFKKAMSTLLDEYKARPSLDNKRKQGIGFFHENLIIISKMLCHHTLMINSIFTYSITLKNLASSSCFFAEVLNWFQSLYISKKKPWPIGFLDIISGRYINKVNLLRCFYIVHRKNRERK